MIVYGLPLAAAFLVRAALFRVWIGSPLTHYSKIPGLDMQTLLEQGRSFYEGNGSFSLYQALIAGTCLLNNGQPWLTGLVLVQMLLGALIGVLVSHCSLRLTGLRWAAAAAGLLAGLYAPALMYESVSLKETVFLFTGALSLSAALECRRQHFRSFWPLLAGLAAAGPLLLRMAGGLWTTVLLAWLGYMIFRKAQQTPNTHHKAIQALGLLFAGAACAILLASIVNKRNCGSFAPFNNNISYLLRVGAANAPDTLDMPESAAGENSGISSLELLGNYASKISDSFRAFELSDNLNYYFIRELLPPLTFLPGPLLLLPLSVTGLLLMLLTGRLCRREGIIFLYLAAFLVPFCLFVPLGRYRLTLLPALAITAPFTVVWCWEKLRRKEKLLKVLLAIALYCLVFCWAAPHSLPIRATDYVALGLALEAKNGHATPAAISCFANAWRIAPDSPRYANHLAVRLIEKACFAEALEVLSPVLEKNPGSYKASLNSALAMNALGRNQEAERLLRSLNPPGNGRSRFIYFFQLGESLRLQGKKTDAAIAFEEALKNCGDKEQEVLTRKLLNECNQ